MGWRGTMRSVGAAMRAAEREAQRDHKQNLKLQMIDDAADSVEAWEQYIEQLISIHTNLAKDMNWESIASTPPPEQPVYANTHQRNAAEALQKFKPAIFDFLQGGSSKKKIALEEAIVDAPVEDEREHTTSTQAYESKLSEWESETSFANRLLSGDVEAMIEAIEEFQLLTDENLIGSKVSFQATEEYIHAIPEVHGDAVVPNYRRKQLASGRLSETKMPVGKFNELYQDYIASVALKVAGDLFSILPISEVIVTCITDMLNTQTGHVEKTPILSVQFSRKKMACLNLAHIDPSDSLANFTHVSSFKKTKGFQAITPLQSIE